MTKQFNTSTARRSTELFQLAGKCIGNLPQHEVMVEEKYDGWRAGHWRGLGGLPRLWTRNEYTIEGIGHIMHLLAAMVRMPLVVVLSERGSR